MGPFLTAHQHKRKSCRQHPFNQHCRGSKKGFQKTRSKKKKQPISTEVVVKICKRFASSPCTLIDLRTSLMFSLGFACLFRANELLALKASDIKIAKDHLEVLVRKSKTDRYHQGNTVYIAKTSGPSCPHSLLLCFYSLAGTEPLTEAYIFQPISSLTNGGKKKSNRPIGYSSYREIIKKALAAVGEIPEMFGTHSLRSGGATAIAERTSDTPDQERLLRLQGRWKTDTSRDAYIKDSLTNRISVTKIIQL